MMRTVNRLTRATVAIALAMAVVLVAPQAASAGKVKGDPADGIEPFARDVYVIVGSSLRNPDDTTADDAELFNDAGVNLNVTWGIWKAVTATSFMKAGSSHSDDALTFSGLIPGGVYSLFYVTLSPDTANPLCPGVERGLPLISTKKGQLPDSSSFVASATGTATFAGRAAGNLLDAYQVFVELVYHNNGQTYGSLPNAGEYLTQGPSCRSSYGDDAMRQTLILQKI